MSVERSSPLRSVVIASVLVLLSARTMTAQEPIPRPTFNATLQGATGRVRSSDARIVSVLRKAYDESVTFRRIVDTIERSDVIAYVEPGKCRVTAVACVTFVDHVERTRYVRATVEWNGRPDLLMARIGHELYHVGEIAAAEEITDRDSFAKFYAMRAHSLAALGRVLSRGFETQEAREAESAIFAELGALARASNGERLAASHLK